MDSCLFFFQALGIDVSLVGVGCSALGWAVCGLLMNVCLLQSAPFFLLSVLEAFRSSGRDNLNGLYGPWLCPSLFSGRKARFPVIVDCVSLLLLGPLVLVRYKKRYDFFLLEFPLGNGLQLLELEAQILIL